jgi:hypothetical protein
LRGMDEKNLTFLGLSFGLALVGFMLWIEHRPSKIREPTLEPSLLPKVPTTVFLLLGAVIMLVSLIHLAALLGVKR